ncbi:MULTISPECIES: hypothetical protein [Butyricimonas]|uniref:hypothetical protein n=1 Tax=Butyricimonas TaxID=574697 RepID=UPI001D095F59|nr:MULTISPECIES: hypothetical protein [Butyricimonas]MCB6973607.1 hypothetical protein [Butyricimonas synergistica]MCG4520290.1 hypothetical protein [Butyricimonas sp. DFI.6.44]
MSTIFIIAKYELKIGRRNWLFRFFLVLIIFVTSYYHLYLQTYSASYEMVTLPSSFPLINSFLFNFLQSLLFCFVVVDLFSREKEIDSLEVIRTRPYNNLSYFLGKLFGFVSLYFVLSLASAGVALFIHVFMSDSPFCGWLYFFYPLTFSLPTFIFVLGLSIWIVELLRNRMLAILILLCILYLIIAYCKSLLPLDLFARELPNGYSNITGLMALKGYLAQRFSFFFVGTGLLLSSFSFQRRLDSCRHKGSYFHLLGLLLILVGYVLGYSNIYRLKEEQSIRNEFRNVYNKYTSSHKTTISYHSITCRLHKEKIYMQSNFIVENLESVSLKQVVLYLNPSLIVTHVTNDNKPISFKRDKQAIIIDIPLMPGAKTSLVLEYEGKVDDRICYLDIPDKDYYHPGYKWQAYVPERRFSFVSDNFTLLLPECLWYPVTQPPINIKSPYETAINLCQYNLQVLQTTTNTIVSQGSKSFRGDTVCFTTSEKLPGLTLCIGPFEQTSAQVNSNWRITSMPVKEHTIWPYSTKFMATQIFPHVEDYGYTYPTENLFFIEVPASVTSYFRSWKNSSELVQPGMVLLQEGKEAGWKGQEEFQDPKIIEWYHINSLLDPYFTQQSPHKRRNHVMYSITFSSQEIEYREKHKYCLRPIFITGYVTPLEFPILNVIMRNLKAPNPCSDMDITLAQLYLTENHSLKDALHEKGMDRNILDAVIYLKRQELANYLRLHSSEEQFELFCQEFMYSPKYNWEQFKLKIQQYFNIDITDFLHKWYNSTSLPFFEIKDVRRLRGEEPDKHFTRLKIRNVGFSDGIVSLTANMHDNREQKYYYLLERGACKEISIKGKIYNLHVNTGNSLNIPASFSYEWRDAVTDYSHDTISGIYDINEREFTPVHGEIIVDNTDPGFQLISPPEKLFITWFKHKNQNENYHTAHWSNLITNSCHGYGKRDAWYTYAGKGDCKAIWETHIEEAGNYEVFVNNVKYQTYDNQGINIHTSSGYNSTVYYTVRSTQGDKEIVFSPGRKAAGWVTLGKFYFAQGITQVVLDNRGDRSDKKENNYSLNLRRMMNWKSNMRITVYERQLIVADAVKWVKVE